MQSGTTFEINPESQPSEESSKTADGQKDCGICQITVFTVFIRVFKDREKHKRKMMSGFL
jgi:hypothetical protein